MAKRRRVTPEFKAEVVFEVLSGASSQAEVCRRHHLNENQLSQWKRQLLENAPSLFRSHTEDALGRTDMLKDSSAPSKRKKFTSMSIKALPRREITSGILSNTCITRNARIRR